MQEKNNNSVWMVILLIIAIVAIGFLAFRGGDETEDNTEDDTTEETSETSEPSLPQTFTLSEQNGSGQNGTVVLEEVDEQVRVTIALSNPTTTAEPAHIHVGRCPTPGAVEFPLNDVVNGSSVTVLDTSFSDLESKGELAVNVHKSATESSVYFACANLDF